MPDLSRRQFLVTAGAAAGVVALSATGLALADGDGPVQTIRQAAATDAVSVQSLRGGIRVLSGSGGNIAVLDGPNGKLLVDAGIASSKVKIRAALDALGPGPIVRLVNTHWHFDHTDGNDWLHDAGATIVAHETTRRRLSVRHRVDGWRYTFPPAPAGALPTITFKNDLAMDLNGEHLDLQYYEPAHTDCDVSVRFTRANVVHVGDTWWNGHYPFIDYSSGGNIDGTIEAAEANVRNVADDAIVIPGHGAVGGRADLVAFRDMLLAVRDAVAALKESGKSLDRAIAAKPTARFDAQWGTFVVTPDAFVALVYQGV